MMTVINIIILIVAAYFIYKIVVGLLRLAVAVAVRTLIFAIVSKISFLILHFFS